jgi:hypothetical protein
MPKGPAKKGKKVVTGSGTKAASSSTLFKKTPRNMRIGVTSSQLET